MNPRHCLVALLSSGLLLVGCGSSSLCDHAYDTNNALNNKGAPCGYAPLAFNRNLCEQNFSSCTSDDQTALKQYYDCLDGVRTCDPNNPQSFDDQQAACAAANPGVSNQTCIDGFTAN